MIFWHEYKQFKIVAERAIANGSNNNAVQNEVLKLQLEYITRDECIENIIEILSDYEHVNPYKCKK